MSRLWDAGVDCGGEAGDVAEKEKLVEKAHTPQGPFNSISFVIREGDLFDLTRFCGGIEEKWLTKEQRKLGKSRQVFVLTPDGQLILRHLVI